MKKGNSTMSACDLKGKAVVFLGDGMARLYIQVT